MLMNLYISTFAYFDFGNNLFRKRRKRGMLACQEHFNGEPKEVLGSDSENRFDSFKL